ncbi:MAG: TrkA C-terminal domain-containing protein [Planctomycetota bacterium]|nr:TrkA C-terminal domain-containing protein [Planctomycetota bacterium]
MARACRPIAPLRTRQLRESAFAGSGAAVVGVLRDGELTINPGADFVLEPHDQVAIIGMQDNRSAFCSFALAGPCPNPYDRLPEKST